MQSELATDISSKETTRSCANYISFMYMVHTGLMSCSFGLLIRPDQLVLCSYQRADYFLSVRISKTAFISFSAHSFLASCVSSACLSSAVSVLAYNSMISFSTRSDGSLFSLLIDGATSSSFRVE